MLISGFVALTLTPMLCAKVLRVPPQPWSAVPDAGGRIRRNHPRIRPHTRAGPSASRGAVLLGAGGAIVLAYVLFTHLKREFIPADDQGWFLTFIIAPEGSSLSYTDGYQRQVEQIISKTPEVQSHFSVVNFGTGPNSGILFTKLKDYKDSASAAPSRSSAMCRCSSSAIPGIFAFASNPQAIGGFGKPVQFVVQNPNFKILGSVMDSLVNRARQIKGLQNVDTDLRVNKPQLTIHFDRDRAEDLGVPVGDIAATLQALLGGQKISTYTRDNKLYNVIVQLDPRERATPSDVSGLYVRGRDNQLVQLSAVTRVDEGIGPRQLNHYNRIAAFTLDASLAPGFTLGEAIDSLNVLAREVLPAGSTTALAGESRELEESGGSLYFAFGLALLVVFMVLASQFESLVHPLTVLMSVPLAVTGALAVLWVAGSTINLYSQIGMILLIGLVTKNSILLVEYANQLKERGMNAFEAMTEAGRIRLRPILMTSVATITSALPIALWPGRRLAEPPAIGLRDRGWRLCLDSADSLSGTGGLHHRRPAGVSESETGG